MKHDDVWLFPEANDKKNRQKVGFKEDRRKAYQASSKVTGEVVDYFEPMRDMVIDLARELGIKPFHILASEVLPKRTEIARSLPPPERHPALELGVQFNSGSLTRFDRSVASGIITFSASFRISPPKAVEESSLALRAASPGSFLTADDISDVRRHMGKYFKGATGRIFEAAPGVAFHFPRFSRHSPPHNAYPRNSPFRSIVFFLHWELHLE